MPDTSDQLVAHGVNVYTDIVGSGKQLGGRIPQLIDHCLPNSVMDRVKNMPNVLKMYLKST